VQAVKGKMLTVVPEVRYINAQTIFENKGTALYELSEVLNRWVSQPVFKKRRSTMVIVCSSQNLTLLPVSRGTCAGYSGGEPELAV
jgi:hypothetical protein